MKYLCNQSLPQPEEEPEAQPEEQGAGMCANTSEVSPDVNETVKLIDHEPHEMDKTESDHHEGSVCRREGQNSTKDTDYSDPASTCAGKHEVINIPDPTGDHETAVSRDHGQSKAGEISSNPSDGRKLTQVMDRSDPATWPLLTKSVIESLVQDQPMQIKCHEFPKDENNRKFSEIHYKRRLANGEEVDRPWLMYSKSQNKVFCFCCKLFSKRSGMSVLQEGGSKDWKNISATLASHERSSLHFECYQVWKELEV